MKWGTQFLVVWMLAGVAVAAQTGQNPNQSAPPGQTPQQNERPTLGPRHGPDVATGPDTSTTIDIRLLMRIHTLFIENIDNSLSDKLVEVLGKWGRFRLVTKAKDADATLRGSCLESRRLKHLHSEIFISDRSGKSVWQDTIYRPFNPPTLDEAVDDTATVVAAHLQRTIMEAERR